MIHLGYAQQVVWFPHRKGVVRKILHGFQNWLTDDPASLGYAVMRRSSGCFGGFEHMILHKSSNDEDIGRAGKEYRVNPERYFLVMEQGWYVLVREGISGPYQTKQRARLFIRRMIDGLCGNGSLRLRNVTP